MDNKSNIKIVAMSHNIGGPSEFTMEGGVEYRLRGAHWYRYSENSEEWLKVRNECLPAPILRCVALYQMRGSKHV